MYKKLDNDVLLIDVRDRKEHINSNDNIIKYSINIPLCVFNEQIQKMHIPKNKQIVIFCNSGNRSRVAYIILKDLGFTNVIDAGGIANLSKLF